MLIGIFVISGCGKHKAEENIKQIDSIYNRIPEPIDIKTQEAIAKAISNWNNDLVDDVPILFYAKVLSIKDKNEYCLHIAFSDEDANVLGIGIRDFCCLDGHDVAVEERYPLYIEKSQPAVWSAYIPIKERAQNQVKDETAWSHYMRSEGKYSIYKEKIPPLWISLTDDPNNIPEAFIYDKDGNISEFVPIEIKK